METEAIVTRLRWALLVTAGLQVLSATVLFPTIRGRLLEPMFRSAEAKGQTVPTLLRSVRFWRSSAALLSLVPLIVWWVLGTPSGLRVLQQVLTGAP